MTGKDPSNYQDREVQKNEQVPIDIKMSDDEFVSPTIVSVNNTVDEDAVKQQATKKFILGKIEVPYITNKNPAVENNLLNLLRNREDFKKWLLATSDYGNQIKKDLNPLVGFDEKFNKSLVRHSLDLKDQAIFCNPNPINVTFHDVKKFDLVNPVIGKLATQVKASKLTDYQLTKKLLEQGEVEKFQLRLDALKYWVNNNDDDHENKGSGGGGDDGTPDPGPPPPRTPQKEMEDIVRRLDILRGNTPDVSPGNTPAQYSRIIARQNEQRIQNRQIRERKR